MPTETFEEFAKRMACEYVEIGQRFIFANGAMSNGKNHLVPPTDSSALVQLQIEFLNGKLREEEEKKKQSRSPRLECEFEFAERQGCPHVFSAGRWVFENGAQWFGIRGAEPPLEDRTAVLVLLCEFLTAKLVQEERLFSECQSYISTQASYHKRGVGPAPAPEAFADLERFQKNIVELRERLQVTESELTTLRGPTPAQRRAQNLADREAAAQQSLDRAMKMQI